LRASPLMTPKSTSSTFFFFCFPPRAIYGWASTLGFDRTPTQLSIRINTGGRSVATRLELGFG
jgi:hypothetical protein